MDVEVARKRLQEADGCEDPVTLPPSVLNSLSANDLPRDVEVQVGVVKKSIHYIEWSGVLLRDGDWVVGEANHTWTRKYWYEPLGLEQYLDLVRRSVETRQRTRGDVELGGWDDDGAYIHLRFKVRTDRRNLGQAYREVRRICDEVEETAHQAVDEIGKQIAKVAARVSGWGAEPLEVLVDQVATATQADQKGRALEELCSRLFETLPGLTVTSRVRTETEEIDLSVLNNSVDPRLKRESAVVLVECKNWSAKCGKNEFVIFRQKLENRVRRCSLGFLISWNGFAETVTKEMLRSCRGTELVVPITGSHLRAAVRDEDFSGVLTKCWDEAVHL